MPAISPDPQPDTTARPSTRRRALLIVNGKARQGQSALDSVLEACEAAGVTVERAECGRREELGEAIRASAGRVDLAIIGGGDGTLNAAAGALAETGLPLAILPLGTANDLARTLGIPLDIEEAARVAVTGRIRRIDLGEVNGVPFFNVASIGLSVELARELTRDMKRRWGTLGYAIAAARVMKRMAPMRARIRIDGVPHRVKAVQIGVGNGRHYGGGMTVDEGASVDDGRLNVYSMDLRGWWEWPLLYPSFRAGRQGRWKNVHTWTCTEAEIVTRRPRPVNTDGELTTHTPARFRLLRRAVAVVCPAEEAEG